MDKLITVSSGASGQHVGHQDPLVPEWTFITRVHSTISFDRNPPVTPITLDSGKI